MRGLVVMDGLFLAFIRLETIQSMQARREQHLRHSNSGCYMQ